MNNLNQTIMIKFITKPFEKFQEKQLLLIGISTALVFSLLQLLSKCRQIAILKTVETTEYPNFFQIIADNIISTLLMSLVLFALGKYINSKTRFIDILNTVLIARIPLYIPILFSINGYMNNITEPLIEKITNTSEFTNLSIPLMSLIVFTIFGLLIVLFLIGFGYYIYQGFKTATHLKKTSQIILFILLILITDIIPTRLLTTLY
ncbi:hypothetical protein [Myroides indicus]|uniref:Yip1-like protein n=1 Tax=Myroides indicus TaxID=1323422 RepID=A0A4R7EUB3_9FLAO|nr:hypothetical protein [Myroides indicus]TDS57532.1 hypothetical protein C8P70_11531 [Myroides indicus]